MREHHAERRGGPQAVRSGDAMIRALAACWRAGDLRLALLLSSMTRPNSIGTCGSVRCDTKGGRRMGAWHGTYANLLRTRFSALVAYAEALVDSPGAARDLAEDASVAVFSRRRAPRDTQAAELAAREWMATKAVADGVDAEHVAAILIAIDGRDEAGVKAILKKATPDPAASGRPSRRRRHSTTLRRVCRRLLHAERRGQHRDGSGAPATPLGARRCRGWHSRRRWRRRRCRVVWTEPPALPSRRAPTAQQRRPVPAPPCSR